MEWQLIDENQWVFGIKVRGLVRNPVAEVYFDKESDNREGGWIWRVPRPGKPSPRGHAATLQSAVEAAEKELGPVLK